MKTIPLARASAAALALVHLATTAGPIAPARYIDAQGVEVIHDRGAPAVDAIPTAPQPGTSAPAPVPASGAAVSPKLTIAPAEQAARDRDRVTILEQELDRESHAYADLWARLNAPPRTPRPVPEDAARMTEQLSAHQKNIQALHAELRRVRASR
jgi:hypothetical protein